MFNSTLRSLKRWLATAAAGALLVSAAACGSSEAAGESSSEPGSGATDLAKERLELAYAGVYGEPQADTPQPEAGKKVWVIAYDLSLTFAQEFVSGAEAAGETLGWEVKVFNSKADPNEALSGIRSAIAARADGIAIEAFDCDQIKSGVEEAIAAGIEIVGDLNQDCSPSLFGALTPYFPGVYPNNDGKFVGAAEAWARPAAAWAAVKTDGVGKIIVVAQTDYVITQSHTRGYVEELADVCPDCEIVDTVEFVGSEIPNLQQKIQQSLLQHPEATVVANTVADFVSDLGIIPAIQASGRSDEILSTGGEGQAANLDIIRQDSGGQHTATCHSEVWGAYSAFDQLIRLFAGAEPSESSGQLIVLVDKDHNMPSEGESCTPMLNGVPVDFAGMYEKIWAAQ